MSITSACQDPGLIPILSIVKKILLLLQIIGPIVAIVSLTINITLMVSNPDNKKNFPKVRNSVIALIVLFMVPIIVNAFFAFLDDSTTISSCWNHVQDYKASEGTIIDTDNGTGGTIYYP